MHDSVLIDIVKKYPHLYDKNRPDFKDESKKERTWIEIADQVSSSVSDARIRFKTLRERLVRERKKMTAAEESNVLPTSTWELYSELTWLLPYLGNPRNRHPSKIYKPSAIHVPYNGEEEVVEALDLAPVESNDTYDSRSASGLCSFTQERKHNISHMKATVASSLNSIAGYVNEHIVSSPAKIKRSSEEEADDIFGKLVTCELRYCKDKKKKQLAKKQIADILFDLQ